MTPPRIGRSPPADLLARLKAVLSTVELLNVDGARSWWMMDHTPVQARIEKMGRAYQHEYDRLKDGLLVRRVALQLLDWGRAGYVCIGRYQEENGSLPGDQMVRELVVKQSATMADMERAFEATELASSATPAQAAARAKVREYFDQEGRSIWRHAKGNKHVTQPGLGSH